MKFIPNEQASGNGDKEKLPDMKKAWEEPDSKGSPYSSGWNWITEGCHTRKLANFLQVDSNQTELFSILSKILLQEEGA